MVKKLFASAVLLLSMFGIASATDVEGGFLFGPQYRTYTLHIPPGYDDTTEIPLVINMMAKVESRMSDKSDEECFLVVYPNSANGPWNAGEVFEVDVDDVGFIDALLDTLIANYAVDTLRIYATGYSNGAMMADRLGCELSHRLGAIAPVAGGLVYEPCEPTRLISVMHFHARDDVDVPYYGDYKWPSIDSTMRRWAHKTGCDLGPDTLYNDSGAMRQRWYRADDSCEIILWTTENGNHTWPGGINIYPRYGSPSQAISATDEMWEFFKVHPIPVEEEPGVQEPTLPPSYELNPVSPGVFNRSATISFSLGSREYVTLEVFDALGRKVSTIVDGALDAGEHTLMLDAQGLSAGVYFYRLSTPSYSVTESITLVK